MSISLSDTPPIPGQVQDFIARHIESVEQLEVLALLVENPGTIWSPEEIFRKVQSSLHSVQNCLEKFAAQGLAKQPAPERFQHSQNDSQAASAALDLVNAYRQRPVKVIECIYGKPSPSIQGFADAFKFRRSK